MRSVVFGWLRNERSGKSFLTHGWEYGFECAGGLQVTWRSKVQLFLLPSAIAYLLFAERFLRSLFLSFFLIYFDGEGELGYEISCCEKIAAVQT